MPIDISERTKHPSVWIGFDHRQIAAFAAARHSIRRRLTRPLSIKPVILSDLQTKGLYKRPLEMRADVMWDVLSDAPMSTEFANSRFLVPHLAESGWALFMDCDILVRANLCRMFDGLDRQKAAYCVKHKHQPTTSEKMDGQVQTVYPRKNWSSFIVFNCDHVANKLLTLDLINTAPGRDLHALCWLADCDIGELGSEWNYLVGHTERVDQPKVVHFTNGLPDVPGYEGCEYADEWRETVRDWASGCLSLPG